MYIRKIWVKDYKQFKNNCFDFTNPLDGTSLKKVCFIGKNGTGKSTVLDLINLIFRNPVHELGYLFKFIMLEVEVLIDGKKTIIYVLKSVTHQEIIFFNEDFDKSELYKEILKSELHVVSTLHREIVRNAIKDDDLKAKIYAQIFFVNNSNDLLIYSPAESTSNQYISFRDVPETNLNSALGLFTNFPYYHIVSVESIAQFWNVIIYLSKKRENDRQLYESLDNNLDKSKRELLYEFDGIHPKILGKLSELWNRILANASLKFDFENASNPIQLSDNLHAYIINTKNNQRINYNQLSTGIRNFIFRIGHIYSLYFNRQIYKGLLIVDEPENSLFPDLLIDMVDVYLNAITDSEKKCNTQMFITTHSPLIASQFPPEERIIFDWDSEGNTILTRGKAPEGDDPNDILTKDFHMQNLLGKKGQEMFEKFLLLKKKLKYATTDIEKDKLINEITKIGSDYNF